MEGVGGRELLEGWEYDGTAKRASMVLLLTHPLLNMALMGDGLVAALSSCWNKLNWSPSEDVGLAMICCKFSCWLKRTRAALSRPRRICSCRKSSTLMCSPATRGRDRIGGKEGEAEGEEMEKGRVEKKEEGKGE